MSAQLNTDTQPLTQGQDVPLADGVEKGKMDSAKALDWAGKSFVFADTALLTSGALAGRLSESAAGFFGLAGGALGSRYSSAKPEVYARYAEQDIGAFLKKENITIPDTPETKGLQQKASLMDKVESFIYERPRKVMSTFHSMIGGSFLVSAVQHKRPSLFVSGMLLIAGALNAIFTPQKEPDLENPPESLWGKIKERIQKRPSKLTSALFNANQVSLGVNTVNELRESSLKSPAAWAKAAAVSGFVTGNTLFGKTDNDENSKITLDQPFLSKILSEVAVALAAHPAESRDAAFQKVAKHISAHPFINTDVETISTQLHDSMQIQLSKQAATPLTAAAV